MPLETLEQAVNEISDRDGSWWPFLWLRPEKQAHLSLRRTVGLAILYGLPSSALMSIALSMLRPLAAAELATVAFAFPMLCLFFGSVVIAPMWNRRADRLRARG
jgi:hypothetical protein